MLTRQRPCAPADHILMLQTSLNHYEYILSRAQPAYMAHLRVAHHIVRGDISTLILAFSAVSIGYLPMQFVTGMFSINVHTPTNLGPDDATRREDGSLRPFNYFFCILVGVIILLCCVLLLIRYWRWQAKQKSRRHRGLDENVSWFRTKWQMARFKWRRLMYNDNL